MTTITITKPFDRDFLLAQIQECFFRVGKSLLKTWVAESDDGQTVTLTLPDDIDAATMQAIIDAHRASLTTKNQVITIAQSAVGIALADLTQLQIKALFAVVLYKAGGVDAATMKVLPLSKWV